MKVSAIVKMRYKNPAHQGAHMKGRRAAVAHVVHAAKAGNPYPLLEADNGRNRNSFSIGLRNAWQAGFDEQLVELKQEGEIEKSITTWPVPNNLAEVV